MPREPRPDDAEDILTTLQESDVRGDGIIITGGRIDWVNPDRGEHDKS